MASNARTGHRSKTKQAAFGSTGEGEHGLEGRVAGPINRVNGALAGAG